MENKYFGVGYVAKRSGVRVSTLHYYEEIGLIKSVRSAANHRKYRADTLRRVSIIKAAQKMGISLQSIKDAFAELPDNRTPSKADWQKLSSAWQEDLNHRINALIALRDSIDACIGCGCLSLKSCPMYNANDELAKYGAGPIILDQKHKSKE